MSDVTYEEVFNAFLKYKSFIFAKIKRHFGNSNCDDIFNQIIVDNIEKIVEKYKKILGATLETYIANNINYMLIHYAQKNKIKATPFSQLQNEDDEREFDPECESVDILSEVVSMENRDTICYALNHLQPKLKEYGVLLYYGDSSREMCKTNNISRERVRQRKNEVEEFVIDFCKNHKAPLGYSKTFTVNDIGNGEVEKRICKLCGEKFEVKFPRQLYCSRYCADKAKAAQKKAYHKKWIENHKKKGTKSED